MYCQEMFAPVLLVIASLVTGVFSTGHLEQNNVEIRRDELESRALGGGALRILCLGASITYGYKSSDGNGFRYGLRKHLVENGQTVNMIGSRTGGIMADNQVEGWEGFRIAEVGVKAELSLPQLPNVVCIHVGTNDMIQGYNIPQAANRLAAIVDRIFAAVPGVTIIVSTLLPTEASKAEANVLRYNADLITVVNSRSAAGKRITLVDMHVIQDVGRDGIHPTDAGYQKMATVFYDGILSMGAVIQPPATVPGVDDAAAPNDKSVVVDVEVSCVITVALSSTKCATSTSKPRPCDPKTSGCAYATITTVTNTQVSTIVPSTTASTSTTVKPVDQVESSSAISAESTGKASVSSSSSLSSSAQSETSSSTSTLTDIQESATTSIVSSASTTPTTSAVATTLTPATVATISATAASLTATAAASTTSSSAHRAEIISVGLWAIVVAGIAGWTI